MSQILIYFYVKIATPTWLKSSPVSQQPPLKVEVLHKPISGINHCYYFHLPMNLFVVQNLKEILRWIQNYDDENCNLRLIKVSPSFPATPSSTPFMKIWLEA